MLHAAFAEAGPSAGRPIELPDSPNPAGPESIPPELPDVQPQEFPDDKSNDPGQRPPERAAS